MKKYTYVKKLNKRQLLMKNVQYIAGLYIDYIKLLDDLTHN